MLLFADDTNILYSHKNLKSLDNVMNFELNNVFQWLTSNKLTLNQNKSNFVIFRPYQKRLSFVPQICILCQASKTHLNKLLILQKRALRFIYFSDRRDHAIPLFVNAHILSINFMHYKLLAETMHVVSNDLMPSNLKDLFVPTAKIHSYNTRASVSRNFYIQKSTTEIQRKSLSRIGAK